MTLTSLWDWTLKMLLSGPVWCMSTKTLQQVCKTVTSTRSKMLQKAVWAKAALQKCVLQLPLCSMFFCYLLLLALHRADSMYFKHIHICWSLAGLFPVSVSIFLLSLCFIICSSPRQSTFFLTYRVTNWNLKLGKKENRKPKLEEKKCLEPTVWTLKCLETTFPFCPFSHMVSFSTWHPHRSLKCLWAIHPVSFFQRQGEGT